MVPLSWKFDLRGVLGMKPADVSALVQRASESAARHWVNKMLPRHFAPDAAQRYAYFPRGIKYKRRRGPPVTYNEWKQRKWHTQQPLVMTGDLRRVVCSPVGTRIENNGTSGRGRGQIVVRIRHHALKPDQCEELRRITDEEQQALCAFAAGEFRRLLAESRAQETVTAE
jgi:hypothetical protein